MLAANLPFSMIISGKLFSTPSSPACFRWKPIEEDNSQSNWLNRIDHNLNESI
jgi:hypothetical protein